MHKALPVEREREKERERKREREGERERERERRSARSRAHFHSSLWGAKLLTLRHRCHPLNWPANCTTNYRHARSETGTRKSRSCSRSCSGDPVRSERHRKRNGNVAGIAPVSALIYAVILRVRMTMSAEARQLIFRGRTYVGSPPTPRHERGLRLILLSVLSMFPPTECKPGVQVDAMTIMMTMTMIARDVQREFDRQAIEYIFVRILDRWSQWNIARVKFYDRVIDFGRHHLDLGNRERNDRFRPTSHAWRSADPLYPYRILYRIKFCTRVKLIVNWRKNWIADRQR